MPFYNYCITKYKDVFDWILFIDCDEFVLPMLPPGGSMDDIIVKVGD